MISSADAYFLMRPSGANACMLVVVMPHVSLSAATAAASSAGCASGGKHTRKRACVSVLRFFSQSAAHLSDLSHSS